MNSKNRDQKSCLSDRSIEIPTNNNTNICMVFRIKSNSRFKFFQIKNVFLHLTKYSDFT